MPLRRQDSNAPQHRKSRAADFTIGNPRSTDEDRQDFTHLHPPVPKKPPPRHGNHPLKLPRRGIRRSLTADHAHVLKASDAAAARQARTASHNQRCGVITLTWLRNWNNLSADQSCSL